MSETGRVHESRLGLNDFNLLAVLGKGHFSEVMLTEAKRSKKLYALKAVKKESVIDNNEFKCIISEKRLFLLANKERHPFLLNLYACFQSETHLYFLMDYIPGGNLMLHLQRQRLSLDQTLFFAAETCLALKDLHENGILHRNLKLSSILLTLEGHIKITDYEFCKENMWYGSTTSTFCGTVEFLPPEILLDKSYGRGVDWWAFGILVYQMLLQQSPFQGDDEDEIYDAILTEEPIYPSSLSEDSVSILQNLMAREPSSRLGSGPTDAQEIMSHAFFRGVVWEDVYHKRVQIPFMPTIQHAQDTSNFDQDISSSPTPVSQQVQRGMSIRVLPHHCHRPAVFLGSGN
jgi:serine/threonine protein kinase